MSENTLRPTETTQYGSGKPDCPICGGLGFVGTDLPVSDPEFGKMRVCVCRIGELSIRQRQHLQTISNLGSLSTMTFDSFRPRGRVGMPHQQADTLEQAYNTASNFAGTLRGWLLMLGRYGTGKTHLAAAIANQAVNMGVETLFLTVPDLLDWLRFAYSNSIGEGFESRFDEIRSIPLLVMDDFGTHNATPWAQEKLFQILDHRYVAKLPTVITSNLNLNDFEGRISSRLLDPELVTRVDILAPDYRNPTDDIGHHELSSLGLHAKQTFDRFELRRDEGLPREDVQSLQEALGTARAYAEAPRGWLVFMGPYGCGKTHLAAAIGNHQASIGIPPLMVVVPDLLDHLRAAFNPNSGINLDKRFEEIRSTRLLILDDLGMQSATPWAREKLYQLFNHRYIAELPTVITTSLQPAELDPRLMARISDRRLSRSIYLRAPAYTGEKRPRK